MPIIISGNLEISGEISYFFDDLHVAPGATLTILPGGSLNLNGHKLLLLGSLQFSGNTSNFAELKNGILSTESTQGRVIGSFAKFSNATVDDFFSNGSMNLTNSYFLNSAVDGLPSTQITSSVFENSQVNLKGTATATISSSTFLDSPVSIGAWTGPFIGRISLSDDNFITSASTNVIKLDPFFNGAGYYHPVSISNSYIRLLNSDTFDSRVYDGNDDLRVATDIVASNFRPDPLLNDAAGFRVGSVLVSASDLGANITTSGDDFFHGTLALDSMSGGAGNDT